MDTADQISQVATEPVHEKARIEEGTMKVKIQTKETTDAVSDSPAHPPLYVQVHIDDSTPFISLADTGLLHSLKLWPKEAKEAAYSEIKHVTVEIDVEGLSGDFERDRPYLTKINHELYVLSSLFHGKNKEKRKLEVHLINRQNIDLAFLSCTMYPLTRLGPNFAGSLHGTNAITESLLRQYMTPGRDFGNLLHSFLQLKDEALKMVTACQEMKMLRDAEKLLSQLKNTLSICDGMDMRCERDDRAAILSVEDLRNCVVASRAKVEAVKELGA